MLLRILSAHCVVLQRHTAVLPAVHHHICAGVPPGLQLLLFAGHALGPDSALALRELALDTYSLAQEVRWSTSDASMLFSCCVTPTPTCAMC
jgi:hypothetical protein